MPVQAVDSVLDPEQQYRRALESLDASLQCPLTLTTMQDPVITQYGHNFERAEIELAAKRAAGETDAALVRLARGAHDDLSEARLREVMLTETMPEIARAFRGSFDRINVTSTNGSEMLGFLSAGLDQVMTVARTREPGSR